MREYVIAKYIRLSIEDFKSDSMSVENQRILLDSYIANIDVENPEILEFVDNGHSGTNFERPGIQKLLGLMQEGQINCIVVKDFSRFGRNSFETANFIERVFPLLRVRFISVDDDFDTNEGTGYADGIDTAFKFLMHEYYSKDLSKKIKTAKRSKIEKGEFVSKQCAFGYKKVGNKLEIDTEAAETIRMIFNFALNGMGFSEILRQLNIYKRPTPKEHHNNNENPSCIWSATTVHKILHDEHYIGTYIAGKTEIISIGSGKQIKKPESEWTKIPNHHAVIIDKEIFEKVKKLLKDKEKHYTNKRKSLNYTLKGKVVCGSCNHALNRSITVNALYTCRFSLAAPNADCYGLAIRERELEEILYNIILKQAQVILDIGSEDDLSNIDIQLCKQAETNKLIESLEDAKRQLYEQLITKEITINEYHTSKADYDTKIIHLTRVRTMSEAQTEKSQSDNQAKLLAQQIKKGKSRRKGLTKSLADALIEKVYVYPNNRIVIIWKISDFSK